MNKTERIQKVKDLLNEAVLLCEDNKDEFLVEVSDTVKPLLTEKEDEEEYRGSDDYYDSNC